MYDADSPILGNRRNRSVTQKQRSEGYKLNSVYDRLSLEIRTLAVQRWSPLT